MADEPKFGPVEETPGWQSLWDWLHEKPGRTPGALARMLGLSQPAVRAWVWRFTRPEGAHRAAVCRLTGADESSWETQAEREVRAAKLALVDAAIEAKAS